MIPLKYTTNFRSYLPVTGIKCRCIYTRVKSVSMHALAGAINNQSDGDRGVPTIGDVL